VNTPAAIASTSDTIKAKSGNPEAFNPAVIPPALYPRAAVTPPEIICQSAIIFLTIIFILWTFPDLFPWGYLSAFSIYLLYVSLSVVDNLFFTDKKLSKLALKIVI
jgi:hypothetical protein